MPLSSLGLALNTCASITVQGDAEPPLFLVEAPIRGAQLSIRLVDSEQLPAAHDFLVAALVRGESVEQISERGIAELRQLGLLAPVDELPQAVDYLPPVDAATLHLSTHDAPSTRAFFEREGFAELPDLLPQPAVAELGRYLQALAAEGFMSLDEDRGSRRHVAHNHPVVNQWHVLLNERVSQLVGSRTKPSYSFVSIYREGGDLKWHTDRPPCEFTITLLLDYAPLAGDARSPWALQVRGRDGAVHALHQRIGDALIFMGRELQHSRGPLPAGHRSASVLFHFVHEAYDGVME